MAINSPRRAPDRHHLQSSGYVTDATGKLLQHVEYLPSGETWAEEIRNTDQRNRTPYLFNGKELDETGLYYYGARYYDPRTSMWQSPDPMLSSFMTGAGRGGGVYFPRNLELYTYTLNNPVNLRDLDGRDWFPLNWNPLGDGGQFIQDTSKVIAQGIETHVTAPLRAFASGFFGANPELEAGNPAAYDIGAGVGFFVMAKLATDAATPRSGASAGEAAAAAAGEVANTAQGMKPRSATASALVTDKGTLLA